MKQVQIKDYYLIAIYNDKNKKKIVKPKNNLIRPKDVTLSSTSTVHFFLAGVLLPQKNKKKLNQQINFLSNNIRNFRNNIGKFFQIAAHNFSIFHILISIILH